MKKNRIIHLTEPNTLAQKLSEQEIQEIVCLKVTGFIGRKDFEGVLDRMCDLEGYYDDDDNFIPDYENSAAIRHLDLGEATYVDGDALPYFGFSVQLETFILPRGIKSTLDSGEDETGASDSELLKSLVLPDGLKVVGGFNCCPRLTGLILPEGLEVIESYAFSGCESITAIHIPSSVRLMSGSSFAGCNISAYDVDENNPYYSVVDGVVYSKDLKTLVAFPSAYPKKHFVVPDTTVTIDEHAFSNSKIESIELPVGLHVVGEWAFAGSHLHCIDVPDTVTAIGEMAFSFCIELKHIGLPAELSGISQRTIELCPNLKEVVVSKRE